ncbi:MAG: 50S ribosomal protein L24 [Alphaproteobacteria bacterium]|nr:50S ribosomal protein L24 [Alphaproteobacteria bacterium]
MSKMKIKKGDRVMVVTGRDKGKQGEVVRVLPEENRVVIAGVNMRQRHKKARAAGEQSQIVSFEAPIHASNVAHIDPASEPGKPRPTRVGFKFLDDGRKVRVARRSGELIDR